VLIADYNGTEHEGVNFATPLDAMKQRLQRFTVNQMPEEQRNEVTFLSLKASREIKGDVRIGRRPYIQYENVRYTNDLLAKSPGLIGKKVDLMVNIDDLRVIRAYLPDGAELGKLKAMGKWGLTPDAACHVQQFPITGSECWF
jgi:putative transposase